MCRISSSTFLKRGRQRYRATPRLRIECLAMLRWGVASAAVCLLAVTAWGCGGNSSEEVSHETNQAVRAIEVRLATGEDPGAFVYELLQEAPEYSKDATVNTIAAQNGDVDPPTLSSVLAEIANEIGGERAAEIDRVREALGE